MESENRRINGPMRTALDFLSTIPGVPSGLQEFDGFRRCIAFCTEKKQTSTLERAADTASLGTFTITEFICSTHSLLAEDIYGTKIAQIIRTFLAGRMVRRFRVLWAWKYVSLSYYESTYLLMRRLTALRSWPHCSLGVCRNALMFDTHLCCEYLGCQTLHSYSK